MQKNAVYLALALHLFGFVSNATDMNMPLSERSPIRQNINSCETFLVTAEQNGDNSVGIPFSSNNIEIFRQEIGSAIAANGLEKFRDSKFYVVGVPMSELKKTQVAYTELAKEFHLASVNSDIVVFDVPSDLVKKESQGLARRILEKTLYFFPSMKKDLQSPQMGELVSGFASAAALEIPNMIFLFHQLPAVDASLAVTSHAIIISSMLIYSKTLTNWILRSGSKTKAGGRVEMFLKNMLTSFPFVLNYNIFGNFSNITNYYAANGWAKTAQAFPGEVANFATTQGLTMFLQALFYSQVVNSGFSSWVNRQVGMENSRDARTLSPWLQAPVLALDAALLAWAASGQGDVLFSIGTLDVNSGHGAMAAMILTGSTLFYLAPNILQPPLKWFQKIKSFAQRVRMRSLHP